MPRYALAHLADDTLLRNLTTLLARDRSITAELLAHLAEVDARKLYLPAAYPSMYAYCLGELRMSEDEAYKRIQAARAAHRFPAVLDAITEGRLHLSAVVLLAPHLTEDNVGDLLSAATHQTKAQIEGLLAERFPRPDVLAWVAAAPGPTPRVVGGPAGPIEGHPGGIQAQLVPEPVPAAPPPGPAEDRPRVEPLSSQSYWVQFTMSRSAHEKLCYAQELLSDKIPSGGTAQVFECAQDALIPQLEKAKFAATTKPRSRPGRSTNSRHIPAEVKRAVWKRDHGRCTFVRASGHRCPARKHLQFDHIQEFACGGKSTVSNTRLRCRAHNQYEAERTYGTDFMRQRRLATSEARAANKGRTELGAGVKHARWCGPAARDASRRELEAPPRPRRLRT